MDSRLDHLWILYNTKFQSNKIRANIKLITGHSSISNYNKKSDTFCSCESNSRSSILWSIRNKVSL